MKLLAIDCATEACSVALFEDTVLLAGECRVLMRGHAEAVVPMIAALPGKGRADRIAVSLGPGSFTGLRVGLAAARALGLAWDVPVLGYSTLALVAAMARQQHGQIAVSAAMTGGHGEWFIANYDAAGAELSAPASYPPAAAALAAQADLIAGSQAAALVAQRGSGQAATILPDARALMELGCTGWIDPPQLIYGRAPDARLPQAAR